VALRSCPGKAATVAVIQLWLAGERRDLHFIVAVPVHVG
jgi:hypothetical protein